MRAPDTVLSILGLFCIVSAVPIAEKQIAYDASYTLSKDVSTRALVEPEPKAQTASANTAPYVDGRLFNIDGISQYFAGLIT